MDPRFSRAYGALAGLALGDALGMPTQAMSPQQIQTVYGHVTGLVDGDKSQPYAPGMAAGSVTDDTEQALLIASLLLKGHGSGLNLDAGEFSHALLAWEDSMIERGSLDLLGPSTKAALERVRAGEDPLRVGGEGTTNGAAMRVTPIGIAASTSDRQLFADAVWSSCQVTHATRQGFQSAALVAAAVSLGIDAGAADVTDLLRKAVAFVRSLPERGAWSPEPDVVAATHRALKLAAQPSSSLEWLAEQIGTSVASAQAIPMAFALLARDPSPRALLQAANLGGDTDTIGAIAGAILGASLGVEVFDGYLMDHPANRQAAQAALEALPEGVQVILDVSPVIGIPQGLPMRDVIVSMNHREAQQIINQSAERGLEQGQELSREQGQSQEQGQDGEQSQGRCQKQGQSQEQNQGQRCGQAREAGLVASLVASLLGRPVVVRAGAAGAYFARPAASANTGADVTYIPTPRVAAIDTNGAGDAHSGVLAAALAQTIPLERALLLANCAGALSTTLVGPASCPAREQIEAAADALAD